MTAEERADWERIAARSSAASAKAEAAEARMDMRGSISEFLARIPGPAERAARARQFAASILRRVNDPTFFERFALKIAWDVLNGVIEEKAVAAVLHSLDENVRRGTLAKTRARYVARAIQHLYKSAGAPLKSQREEKRE